MGNSSEKPDHNISQMKFYDIYTYRDRRIIIGRIGWFGDPMFDLNSSDKDQEIGKQSNLSVRPICSRDE